jgi:acyl carrier protein
VSGSSAAYSHAHEGMSDIAREVTAQIAAVLGEHPERITPNALLVQDLGADSLDSVALTLAIEDRFAIDMPDEEVEQLRTVRQLIEYVELAVAMASPARRRAGHSQGRGSGCYRS